jgi:hypothetical protein
MKLQSQLFCSAAAIAGTLCFVSSVAIAQTTLNNNNPGTFQNNEINTFDGLEQGSFDPLDIFHMMNLGGRRSLGEFRQDQNHNLNDAAAKFRRQQLELLNNNNSSVDPEAPSDNSP